MKPITALIVDDDKDVGDYIGEVFRDKGIVPKLAYTYSESLNCCNQDFDILFVDFFIENFKGTEIIKEYKKVHPGTKAEVIIYSGQYEKIDTVDKVLYKPISLAELNKYIDEILTAIKNRKQEMDDIEQNNTDDIEAKVYRDVCSSQCIKIWDSRYLLREEFHDEMTKIKEHTELTSKENRKFLVGTFIAVIGIFTTIIIAAINQSITISNQNAKNQANIDQIGYVGQQLSIEVSTSKIDMASIKDNMTKISSDVSYLKGKLENKK